jgi:hypothetical protein
VGANSWAWNINNLTALVDHVLQAISSLRGEKSVVAFACCSMIAIASWTYFVSITD